MNNMKGLNDKLNLPVKIKSTIEPDELYSDIDDSDISMVEIYKKSEKYQHLTEQELIALEKMDKDEQEDFIRTRGNLTDLTRIGAEALEKLQQVSELTQEPRAYEVLAKLIQSLKETNESLYDIHEKRRKLKNIGPVKDNKNENSINVEKAVFVGDPKDLLNKNLHKIKE